MPNQLVCVGCRNLLLFPRGASSVRCAICNAISSVPATGMAQITCMGCCTLLMYTRGAAHVRCSCCNTVNLVREANQTAYITCGRCRTTLMYASGASSVKCSVCQHITTTNVMAPTPPPHSPIDPSTSELSNNGSQPQHQNQTVVVENPMSVDEHGKLVSNVVVGVTTGKD